MGLSEASSILWRQRHLLELLLFKLEVEHTFLASGRTRWLTRATNEVGLVLDELRLTELARSVAIDEVAASLDLPSGCTLHEITQRAPGPWAVIFTDHRTAFLQLADEISAVAGLNKELAATGQQALAERLAQMSGAEEEDRFDLLANEAHGWHRRVTPVLLDEAL